MMNAAVTVPAMVPGACGWALCAAVASLLVGAQCERVSPRSAGKCGGAERRKGATALPIRICRGTTFPWWGKEVRRQRKNCSANTALHSLQRSAM
ncbi:hypothetical protein B0H14DRAFT_2711153, partial [Mycena olivaceomarginata]